MLTYFPELKFGIIFPLFLANSKYEDMFICEDPATNLFTAECLLPFHFPSAVMNLCFSILLYQPFLLRGTVCICQKASLI